MKGDVYPMEPEDDFALNQVLDAHWGFVYDEDVRKQFSMFFLTLLLSVHR